MENASKALIMAGGILVGVLILSLAVYLFISFGANSAKIYEEIENQRIMEFNAQFTVYKDKDNVTIHDIVTAYNIAKENNEYYKDYADYSTSYEVNITIQDNNNILTNKTSSEIMTIFANDTNLDTSYTVVENKIEYHSNGRISKIVFKAKNS